MLVMTLYTHGLGLVAEAERPGCEVASLALHLRIHCFNLGKYSPIPLFSKLVIAAPSMSWWHDHSSTEVCAISQILGTTSYWCLVPNIIVIIELSIVDENLNNASSKLSF